MSVLFEVVKFFFEDIWHFIGLLVLIWALGEVVSDIITESKRKAD